jgi:glycoside/pentoside/hexuronide:cation symporter, GPH family
MSAAHVPAPLRLKFIHGLGSVAYGVKDNGFATFLLLFYNQVLGMEAALVSLALMVAQIIDAFADPVIGHMTDRTYTKWGRRLPWLYLAPIPLAFAWMLIWSPPALSDGQLFFYLVAVAILVRTLVSCCEVPSVALVPELTPDYYERTSFMRFRYLFGWAGGLLMLFLAFGVFLVPDSNHTVGLLNGDGYWQYGLLGGVLMAGSVLISALGQHKRVAHWPETRLPKIGVAQAFGEIRESFSNRAFLIFVAAAGCAFISQGITFSLSNYLYVFVWQFTPGQQLLYPAVLFGAVIGSFFLVGPLNRRWDKPKTAVICALVGVSFWVTPFLLRLADLWPTVGTNLSTGLVFCFFFMSTLFSVMVSISGASMVADIVEASELETGRRTEGLFFSGNFFMQKCATGFGIFFSGLIISWAGLSDKATQGQVPDLVLDKLTGVYCLLVILLSLGTAFIFSRFPIRRADHEARLAALARNPN